MGTATVLTPDVRTWRRTDPEHSEQFLEELRKAWETECLSPFERLVRGATLAQIEQWQNRLLYVPRLDDVFDPAWRLPVQLVDRFDLIRRAIADPLRTWTLVLTFLPSRDSSGDRRYVEHAIPWFLDLRQVASVWSELRKGQAVLGCPDAEWAQALFSSIRRRQGERLTAQLFTNQGRRAAG